MVARKDVQRQITIVAVVAVKEAAQLMAVHRVVRGVQVQDDLTRGMGERLQEEVHQLVVGRGRLGPDYSRVARNSSAPDEGASNHGATLRVVVDAGSQAVEP